MESTKDFKPIHRKLNIIIAEDDYDDQLLFEEAINELPVSVEITTFKNGDELMEWLTDDQNKLPDALYLDLNMPRKNGFAALSEIKKNPELQNLPVIIFSTATNKAMIKQVFKDAAHFYIRKPANFWELKALLYKSLKLIEDNNIALPGKSSFMLTID